jgi:hypothetical protein
MSAIRPLALLIRFLSELGALLGFTLWGFSEAGWFGVLPPLAAAAVWGRWMAPRSEHRLADPRRLAAEIVFFGAAASAFASADAPVVGVVYGIVAIVFAVLVRYTGEPEAGPAPAA